MSIYLPVFSTLNNANKKYIIVGGLATLLHGYMRLTANIDLIINLKRNEALKCITTLLDMGLTPRLPVDPYDFANSKIRKIWMEKKNMNVFSLFKPNDPLISVGLFVDNPIQFEDLWDRGEIVDIGGQEVKIASIPDLISLKEISGRPQDIEDINKLRTLLENK